MIYFADPVTRVPEWRVLGGPSPPLDETYTLTLMVRNRVYDDDRNTAETRTWALIAIIEQAVRADLRLGGLIRGFEFGEQEVSTSQLSDGFFGEATVPLICTART
jgi:hypothetical protein